jgi:anti-sigma factor RsiW
VSGDGTELTHQEIQELLGVYALDAVDAETAAVVERHLAECVRCSVEVAQHHEVAGLLANSGGESPAELWGGIARQLDGSRPPSWERLARRLETDPELSERAPDPREVRLSGDGGERPAGGPPDPARAGHSPSTGVIPIGSGRRRNQLLMRGAVIVAAAAAVVAVVLGVQVNHLHHQVTALQSPTLSQAEQAAVDSPSSKKVLLSSPTSSGTSSVKVTVVLTTSGTGFVEASQLSSLPGSETYQLWGVIGSQTISLGLLGPHPRVVPFSVAGNGQVAAFAITAEHAGGVVQSAHQPVVSGDVTT